MNTSSTPQYVVRPISLNDTESFIDIALHASLGMTSMPKNRERLVKRIDDSLQAFQQDVQKPENERYIFVIEDTQTKEIGGTSSIVAREKHEHPVCIFSKQEFITPTKIIPILQKVSYYDTPSEICSLYLLNKFQKQGAGRLLSLARYLYIAAFPDRFDKMVWSWLRGYIDANNHSAFWDGIGRHFFEHTLEDLMHLRDIRAIDINSIIPDHPIYIDLLPKIVQKFIGKVHHDTLPALNILFQEGFQMTDDMDPIDGGPIVEAETATVRTISTSIIEKVYEITKDPINSPQFILSNNNRDFRACYGKLKRLGHHGVSIHEEVAKALNVGAGDLIRYVTTHP